MLIEPEERVARGRIAGAESLRLWRRPDSWEGVYEHAQRVLDFAKAEAGFCQRWVLFSGGNDSIVLLHVILNQLNWPIDGVLHVNTRTGVREGGRFLTSDFARSVVEGWGVPFVEAFPPLSYEEVFIDEPVIDGLPGPGMHHIAYARLKERAIGDFWQSRKRNHWDRVILPSGVRKDESKRRMGYGTHLVNRNPSSTSQFWCNPIYYATSSMMDAYRAEHDLPRNPVSEHLGMSGECLCGAYAAPGELDEVSFFYPETGDWLRSCEQRAKAKGCTYWAWGTPRPDQEVLEQALAAGLITEDDLWPAGDLCGTCGSRRDAMEKALGRVSLFDSIEGGDVA